MKVVIRIGGSVIASPPDPRMVDEYSVLLRGLSLMGHEVAVVVGGGSVARQFIEFAKQLSLAEEDQDKVAIGASRLIAQLLAAKLGEVGLKRVPTSVNEAIRLMRKGRVVVMGGLKPGMTTDAVAALLAREAKAELLIKATDQEGVYTKDPRKHPEALKIDEICFDDLAEFMAEDRHKAGIHQVLDPEAVRLLQRDRTCTVIVNGFKPENVRAAIEGRKVGTIIQ